MKICFLATADSIHSKKWIEYFFKKGNDVHWISLTPSIFAKDKNIKFYLIKNFPVKSLGLLLNILPVRKLIRKINPDVLHAHYAGVNGVLAALSGFHPFILTPWGSDILINAKSRIMRPLIKFVLNKADLITCDAEQMKEELINLGIIASKIKITYFGVDTEKFSPGPKDQNLIKELGLQNNLTVISLRNLEPIYDLETLIKAILLIVKEFPKVKFIIAGKGSEEKKLKTLAENLKISENITFIGFIPNDELPKYLRLADIYISTSLSDSTSVSLLEAMSCGLASVVTEVGENKLILKDGGYGVLIPVKNSKILAEKIIYLLKNEETRNKIGKIGRKIIEEKYNYYKEMANVENLYKDLIKTKL